MGGGSPAERTYFGGYAHTRLNTAQKFMGELWLNLQHTTLLFCGVSRNSCRTCSIRAARICFHIQRPVFGLDHRGFGRRVSAPVLTILPNSGMLFTMNSLLQSGLNRRVKVLPEK